MNGIPLQLELLPPPKASVLNLNGLVRSVLLSDGEWLTPSQIQRGILNRTGEMHSDSSITARIRDLRKPEYGGHVIEKRIREGSRAYEYRLAGVKQ
jgi:hypothetical protein